MGRSILILLLILVILVSLHPQVQAKITKGWDEIRPAVVASMDGVYAIIRSFVAGDDAENRQNDSPFMPGIRFDMIVT